MSPSVAAAILDLRNRLFGREQIGRMTTNSKIRERCRLRAAELQRQISELEGQSD
jgi:hypothetical protein